MNISEYSAASPTERAAARAAWSRRADSATRRLRRMTEVEIANAVRARFPEAVKVRATVDDGDDAWCMAVGFYGPRGRRLALDNYDQYPQLDRTIQRLVEDAWAEGGRDAWPYVDNDDEDDYPLSYAVREIRLPRWRTAPPGD
ncbi:hypothetical protein EDC02_7688 [Micromonospora sp. Llam0]|uniref:hypothetical protein n=1 Tax=Micromonospora sp. Llam0 TaxID=2485143 RepID=UPI000F48ABD0|nr:hypothetical protein [Micromonospora sp. Llam0]ROO52747.1 hypothetical protein EDC02_7688 [Micromonospora sp. Llam0]